MYQMKRKAFVMRLKSKIQYFEDNSSLRRFGHVISIAKTPLFKRLFWFVFLSAFCIGAGAVLRGALILYTQDAVSYSVETDYLEWDTPFPAITLCQQFSTEKLTKEALDKKDISPALYNFAKETMYWTKSCKFCVNCKMNKTCVNEIVPLVEAFRATCDEMLTDCWWNDEWFSCCDRFQPIQTQYGPCFVFNSLQFGTEYIEIVNRAIGLPVLTFTSMEYMTVKVHSRDEILTVASDNSLGKCGDLALASDLEVSLSAEQTISDASVRGIAQGSRDCLFLDERPTSESWPFPRYSYSGCIWYCKARAQVNLCNCTHHYMPRVDDLPICDVQGLICLHRNQESLITTDECVCPMDCEEMTYRVVYVACSKLPSEELVRGTRGRLRLANLPSLRVRRHAIRDMLGLVVDFGGVIGVFFGASLLSFIEIVYIFCIRKSH